MQRVRIVFDRNQDSITEHYLVYRAMGQAEPVLAYIVAQPPAPNPIRVINEVLERRNDVYYTAHGNIIEERGITVMVDGQQVIPVAVDYRHGTVRLDPVPPEDCVVTASYWFDGVEFLDTTAPQEGVTRMAPAAIDRSPPLPVQNLRLGLDTATGLVRLEFDFPPPTQGTTYRYYVVAADRLGNRSWPSETATVTLNQSLGEVPFVIQRSDDGGITWAEVAETKDRFFLDLPLFSGPMGPPQNLRAEVIPADGESGGSVKLSWDPPAPATGSTAMYRVITRSALGSYSDPSEPVGPESVERIAVRYIIRRQKVGGAEEELGGTKETSFTDSSAVEAYATYTYAVQAVDALGNVSPPATVTVETGDLMGPEAPELIEVANE